MRVLEFLGLIGDDGGLSLTQLLLYVITIRLCVPHPLGYGELLVATIAGVNYIHRRAVRSEREADKTMVAERLALELKEKLDLVDKMQERLNSVSVKLGFGAKV